MKKLSFRAVTRLAPPNVHRAPAPFPGQWPTRIYWGIVARGRGQTLRRCYIGKPVPAQVKQLRDLAGWIMGRPGNRFETLEFGEFDRHSILYRGHLAGGWKQSLSRAWSAYHHWERAEALLPYFAKPVFLKRIGGFRCYSPQEVLKKEYVLEFKEWLAKTFPPGGLAKPDPAEIWPVEQVVDQPAWRQHMAHQRLAQHLNGHQIWWRDDEPLPDGFAWVVRNQEDGRQIRWLANAVPVGWTYVYMNEHEEPGELG